jgi:epsilon-lactone hydrolase
VVRGLGSPLPKRGEPKTRGTLALDWLNGDVSELRAAYERACAVGDPRRSGWIGIDRAESPLRVLLHEPSRPSCRDCAIVYFHGGGWIAGSPLTHADISGALCEASGLRVASVEYRLAPEHKAPAPVEDGLLALEHFLAEEWGPDRVNHVFLCGDSAGAAIALAVERSASYGLRERIAGVLSLYGGFGLSDTTSMRLYGRREDGLDTECIKRYWALANRSEGESPYSVAALAAESHVPIYLLVCGRDPLKDDSFVLAEALQQKGRSINIDLVEPATHGFLHEHSGLASQTIERIARWMNGTLSALS